MFYKSKATVNPTHTSESQLDYRMRICLVGKPRTGKKSLAQTFAGQARSETYEHELIYNSVKHEVIYKDKKIPVEIFYGDIDSTFCNIHFAMLLKHVDAVVLTLDSTVMPDFAKAQEHYKIVTTKCPNVPIFLAGTMSDKDDNYCSHIGKLGQTLTLEGIKFVSIKHQHTCNELFYQVIERCLPQVTLKAIKKQQSKNNQTLAAELIVHLKSKIEQLKDEKNYKGIFGGLMYVLDGEIKARKKEALEELITKLQLISYPWFSHTVAQVIAEVRHEYPSVDKRAVAVWGNSSTKLLLDKYVTASKAHLASTNSHHIAVNDQEPTLQM